MRLRWLLAAILLVPALVPARAAAGDFTPQQRAEIVAIVRDALRTDPTILRDAVAAIQADEQARQTRLSEAAVRAQRASLVQPGDPQTGNPKGDVTIVEFYDTRCPYCRALDPQMAKLLRRDPGVRLVYKDIPILGPASVLGARAVLAAQAQGGYERLRDALMQSPAPPTQASIAADAARLGLDPARLARDMEAPAVQQRIDANLKLAGTLGINGTPAFIVGGKLYTGAMDETALERIVTKARNG